MVIHPKEKNKASKEGWDVGEWVTILDRVTKRKPH